MTQRDSHRITSIIATPPIDKQSEMEGLPRRWSPPPPPPPRTHSRRGLWKASQPESVCLVQKFLVAMHSGTRIFWGDWSLLKVSAAVDIAPWLGCGHVVGSFQCLYYCLHLLFCPLLEVAKQQSEVGLHIIILYSNSCLLLLVVCPQAFALVGLTVVPATAQLGWVGSAPRADIIRGLRPHLTSLDLWLHPESSCLHPVPTPFILNFCLGITSSPVITHCAQWSALHHCVCTTFDASITG